MRNSILGFLMLVVTLPSANLRAQDSTDYFPLHVGDFWRYKGDEQPWASTKATDTISINGNKYYILSGILVWSWTVPYPDTVRLRADSNVVFYRNGSDHLFYRLNAAVGDTWSYSLQTPSLTIEHVVTLAADLDSFQIKQGPLLGTYHRVKVFFNDTPNYSDGWSYDYLAPGLGLIFRDTYLDRRVLYGATIGGELYGDTSTTDIKLTHAPIPSNFKLLQNYPNPFNPSTTIGYQVPINSFVVLKVFDILGREVQSLVNERQSAGNHYVRFSAANLPTGVYFYRLQAGTFTETKKLTVLK
jgi:hypothetical protein